MNRKKRKEKWEEWIRRRPRFSWSHTYFQSENETQSREDGNIAKQVSNVDDFVFSFGCYSIDSDIPFVISNCVSEIIPSRNLLEGFFLETTDGFQGILY
jgi:hypothetical protein